FIPLVLVILLAFMAASSERINTILQKRLYYDDIVFTKRSKFQDIVMTRSDNDFRLYLDGSLQFSSVDEYRYHEMLAVHALMLNKSGDPGVLILGGGDGLAVREVLKMPRALVTLVELDPSMLDLAKRNSSLRMLNGDSLNDHRVKVVEGDAYRYLLENRSQFGVIIADFPDPHDETISKLYTVEFYALIRRSLRKGGTFVTQSTSPFFAREAFWCIHATMKKVFDAVIPYHIYVPSFGDWGFNIAFHGPVDMNESGDAMPDLRHYTNETFLQSLHFPADSSIVPTKVNTFNRAVLYRYYLKGWKNYADN
ncbi:MAG: hypothetical protein E4G96_09525, partial [Chrysiogenales bacterium]